MPHQEVHYVLRSGWLRAAVLGANDGLISTASLVVGVAAASAGRGEILTAAFAGWAAGAMSMAAGEFVSVSSQADLEAADLEREKRALMAAFLSPPGTTIEAVSAATLIFLLVLGAPGAWLGGAKIVWPALRVGFWGAVAMAVTAGIGGLVGKAV